LISHAMVKLQGIDAARMSPGFVRTIASRVSSEMGGRFSFFDLSQAYGNVGVQVGFELDLEALEDEVAVLLCELLVGELFFAVLLCCL